MCRLDVKRCCEVSAYAVDAIAHCALRGLCLTQSRDLQTLETLPGVNGNEFPIHCSVSPTLASITSYRVQQILRSEVSLQTVSKISSQLLVTAI